MKQILKSAGFKGVRADIYALNHGKETIRCLEHYLPFSLANYYGLKPQDFHNLMPQLLMHRPYGIAGRLPWQNSDAAVVPFGGGGVEQTVGAASQIRTFTERVEEGSELSKIRSAVRSAERIVFLGFAFHRQNVELLATTTAPNVELLATAYEISKSDAGVIETELETAFEIEDAHLKRNVELANATCSKFFQDYWRTLTAEPATPW